MKKLIFILCLFFAVVLYAATQWTVMTEKAIVRFEMPAEEVVGTLSGLKATFQFDENNLNNSKIVASVDVASIKSGDVKRDAHLKTADFFDVKKFPVMIFTSSSFKKNDDKFWVMGDLKIKETVKPIEIPFQLENSGSDAVFKGSFTVYPSDFGVTEKPKDDEEREGEKVIITVEVPVTK